MIEWWEELERTLPEQTSKWRFGPSCDPVLIEAVTKKFGDTVPKLYLDFLRRSDGGTCAHADLYPAAEVLCAGDDSGMHEDLPGIMVIGGDGGGEAIAFDLRQPSAPVVAVPWIGRAWDTLWLVAKDFPEFLAKAIQGPLFGG